MRVEEVMKGDPYLISPEATLQQAAQKMLELDTGVLAVGMSGYVTGMITDRDLVIRAMSELKDPEFTKVSDIMTLNVITCRATDDVEQAADKLRNENIHRLVVEDESHRAVGIVSIEGLLRDSGDEIVCHSVMRHYLWGYAA